MKTYAERLAHAMRVRGLDPGRGQTELAGMVGKPCAPQNIQALLNRDKPVTHSKYTLAICKALRCDPFWLELGEGPTPQSDANTLPAAPWGEPRPAPVVLLASDSPPRAHYWPFKIDPKEFAALMRDEDIGAIDAVIQSYATLRRSRKPNGAAA